MPEANIKIISQNKKARHDYFIIEIIMYRIIQSNGKKFYDKCDDIAKRDSTRKMDRAFKEHNNQ